MTGETGLQKRSDQMEVATRPQGDALVQAVSQREIAEVQAMMLVAQRFPRDERAARERILIACQRAALAEGAVYEYARGGTNITGPSIRLAEAIAQNWGNLDFGIRELDQSPGESTMQAYAWDLERNVRQVRVFKVKHIRTARGSSYALDDPRDIYEMTANQGARRVRACLLGLIPGDIVEDAVTQCENTLKAKADTSPEGIKQMLAAFAKFGVMREQIEVRLQRKLDAITPAQMTGLLRIRNSMKDGMSVAADWFQVEAPAEGEVPRTGAEAAKAALGGRKSKERPAEAPETATPEAPQAAEPAAGGGDTPWEADAPQTGAVEATNPNEKVAYLNAVEQLFTLLGIAGPKRQVAITDWASSVKLPREPKGPTDMTIEELAQFVEWLKEQE